MNRKLINNWSIFVMLFSLVFLFSCATKKIVSKKSSIKDNNHKILSEISNAAIKYNNLSYRFNGRCLFLGQDYNFNGIIRIKKDSIIWMSVRLSVGVEIARIVFTENNIKMRSAIAEVDIDENYSFLKNTAGVKMNFNLVQTILTDNLNTNIYTADIDFEGEDYCIDENFQFVEEEQYISEKYCFDTNTYKMSNLEVFNTEENYKIKVNYSDFNENNDLIFPERFKMELRSKNDSIIGNTKISNLVIDKANIKFPFKKK